MPDRSRPPIATTPLRIIQEILQITAFEIGLPIAHFPREIQDPYHSTITTGYQCTVVSYSYAAVRHVIIAGANFWEAGQRC